MSIAVGMDIFTIAISKSTSTQINKYQTILTGLFFGGFHGLMPLLGWFAGESVRSIVTIYGPLISFLLIFIVGANMLNEGIKNKKTEDIDGFSYKKVEVFHYFRHYSYHF
ncbi:manganese efflux pump MntP [Methanobrevibacter curvatus]|uniref:manganese efflux pump MntP n=1 Tax=Methanobrevibacter curvatus TaxID=49547 RepID=UPI001471C657|nr:manganese efflux pump [Methanobrevibacter curvatus]